MRSDKIQLKIVLKNGQFLKQTDPLDKRRVLYRVQSGTVEYWVSKDELIAYFHSNKYKILNATLQGDKIVKSEQYSVEKINKENLYKVEAFIKRYLNSINPNDYADSTYFYFQDALEENFKSLLKVGYVGLYNSELKTIFVALKLKNSDITEVHTVYGEYDRNLSKFVFILSKRIKNSVFYFEYLPEGLSPKESKFKFQDMTPSFDEDHTYDLSSGCYLSEYSPKLLSNYIERNYMPIDKQIDFSQLEIKRFTTEDLINFDRKFDFTLFSGYWSTQYNNGSKVGFTYLQPNDYYTPRENNKYFLVAIYKGFIIGVIKYGIWPHPDHQAVAYIDVHKKYRNQGVATLLVKELNKYLNKKYTLVLTDESEMGKICHMNKLFKDNIKSVKVKTYAECYEDKTYV